MSDFEDDLLALAEGGSKRKSKSGGSKPNKRRRPAESEDDGSASDMDMSQSDSDAPAPSPKAGRGRKVKSAAHVDSSEGDDDSDVEAPTEDNPYPLEGIYKDDADRRAIKKMNEVEREATIGARKDEISARELRKQVAQVAKKSGGKADENDSYGEDEEEEEEEKRSTTRSRKLPGKTDKKAQTLEALKKSRAEKGKKKAKKPSSDSDDSYASEPRRGKKSSRRKNDYSSEEDGDTESSEEETKKKFSSKASSSKKPVKTVQPATIDEFKKVVLTRSKLADVCAAPWFDKWVKGAWVRLAIGLDNGDMKYRLCQIVDTKARPERSYRLENTRTNIFVELQHAKTRFWQNLELVSNGEPSDREYDRLKIQCTVDEVPVFSSKDASKLKEQLAEHTTYIMTEEDLSKRLAEKPLKQTSAVRKTILNMERHQALTSNDTERLAEIDAELALINKPSGQPREAAALLNEKNRKSNMEEVRRAEARGQDERRRQQEALAKGDASVKVDASARVKTVPRMNYDLSRTATPIPGTPNGLPTPSAAAPLATGTPRQKLGKIEAQAASRVQLDDDLLDF